MTNHIVASAELRRSYWNDTVREVLEYGIYTWYTDSGLVSRAIRVDETRSEMHVWLK